MQTVRFQDVMYVVTTEAFVQASQNFNDFQCYFKTKIPNFRDNSECYEMAKTQDHMLHMVSSRIIWPLWFDE